MKSIVKTTLTLSLLLPLAGCWDCSWTTKKSDANGEVATHGNVKHKTSKCSHKGCTHDHSKDNQGAMTETMVTKETTTEVVDNDAMEDQAPDYIEIDEKN